MSRGLVNQIKSLKWVTNKIGLLLKVLTCFKPYLSLAKMISLFIQYSPNKPVALNKYRDIDKRSEMSCYLNRPDKSALWPHL